MQAARVQVANERTLRDLEYEKVKEIIKGFALTPLGREQLDRLLPSANPDVIRTRLARVEEMRRLLEAEGFSLGRFHDLRPQLARAREATTLDPEEFLPILETLVTARRLKERLYALEGEGYPHLLEIAKGLGVFRELEESIQRAIDEQGQLKETASPRLRELTLRRRALEEQIKGLLEGILQSSRYAAMIQDTVITLRGGRLVIPIKASAKRDLDWVVQDSSDSGQTLYAEPRSVVELNNKLRELEGEIRKERIRVLRELTAKLQAESRRLSKTLRALGLLDALWAAARYAQRMRCAVPALNTHGRIELVQARHPLLPPESVVPIDIKLGAGDQGVLITGPNTGGKTVTLKTIGLLTLMVQSGFPVPASPDTTLAIFRKVRSDIGSEESIEQSLSTFSSHLRNIIGILKEADERTLVLLDELGAGTDPQEGAALGIAILRYLLRTGARMAVTTHFSALKHFAYQDPRLRTCSVEFDVETLAPTYRILDGVGASNALIVAERLGLDQEIVAEARRAIPAGEVRAEEIIQDLQRERALIRREREELEQRLRRARQLEEEYRRRLERLERRKEEALSEELRQLKELLRQTKRKLEAALHHARAEEARRALKEVLQSERELQAAEERLQGRRKSLIEFDQLAVGQRVYLEGAERVGVVREILGPERIEVEIGGVRVWAKLSDLRWPPEEARSQEEQIAIPSYTVELQPRVQLELSVRGLTVAEALARVDRFLDRLLLSEVGRGYIVHGKGSGTLRREIRKHLEELPFVKSFYPAPPQEGGDGVTVVELDLGDQSKSN